MSTGNYLLQVENLNVFYGNFHAVRDVSFLFAGRDLRSYWGPNGLVKQVL
jgi:ABC-type uncharacterized transport system ATPase subunit